MLVQISIIYCMVHMYVFLFLFYEYRCSRRVFAITAISFFLVISSGCLAILFTQGVAVMGQWGVLIGTAPTLIFFFLLSRRRDAHFLFIFCLSDTVCIWIELATALVDYWVKGNGVVTFALRLVAFPLLEYAVWRWLRQPFLQISHLVRKGWLLFALMTGSCYLILVLISVFPTAIFERPQDMPLAAMVLVLIALAYATIFQVLFEQLRVLEAQERQQVLEAQAAMMSRRVEDMRQAEESMRIERHDMRHRLQSLAALVREGEQTAALEYIGASQDALDGTSRPPFCKNVILDAVLASFFERARERGIQVEPRLAVPDPLPVDATELSTVLGNALENAIRACEELPREERRILCTCIAKPALMLEIANPYAGELRFGPDGLPLSDRPGHGVGVRSIVAFAEKNGAVCQFQAEDGWFKVQIAL